jgi:hypothetical protein
MPLCIEDWLYGGHPYNGGRHANLALLSLVGFQFSSITRHGITKHYCFPPTKAVQQLIAQVKRNMPLNLAELSLHAYPHIL